MGNSTKQISELVEQVARTASPPPATSVPRLPRCAIMSA